MANKPSHKARPNGVVQPMYLLFTWPCLQYRLVHDFIISMNPTCTFNIPASLAQTTPLQLPVQMLCGQPLLSSQGYNMTLVCLLQLLDQRVQVISTVSLGVCSFYIRVTLSVVCITYTCSAGMYLGCSLLFCSSGTTFAGEPLYTSSLFRSLARVQTMSHCASC